VFNIFAETMDPLLRDLGQEEALENIISESRAHGPDVEPPKSPSSFLNLSGGDGMEVDSDYPLRGKVRTEIEDGSDYGEDGSSGDDGEDGSSGDDGEAGGRLTKSGEVYRCNCNMWKYWRSCIY
jgi:hypothetical protein